MKDRVIICKYYTAHGECLKGKRANLSNVCQHCSKYEPKKGAVPFKRNKKSTRIENLRKKELLNV